MEMKQAMMMVESGIAPKLPTVVSSVSMSWVSVTSHESRCRVVKSLYIECVSAETFSREEQPDDGRSRASPRVARRRSERFWGATCRRPDRGSVSQGRVSCFTNKHFVLTLSFVSFLLSSVLTADTTCWSTRSRTHWAKSASGSRGWRWRGGWVRLWFWLPVLELRKWIT